MTGTFWSAAINRQGMTWRGDCKHLETDASHFSPETKRVLLISVCFRFEPISLRPNWLNSQCYVKLLLNNFSAWYLRSWLYYLFYEKSWWKLWDLSQHTPSPSASLSQKLLCALTPWLFPSGLVGRTQHQSCLPTWLWLTLRVISAMCRCWVSCWIHGMLSKDMQEKRECGRSPSPVFFPWSSSRRASFGPSVQRVGCRHGISHGLCQLQLCSHRPAFATYSSRNGGVKQKKTYSL